MKRYLILLKIKLQSISYLLIFLLFSILYVLIYINNDYKYYYDINDNTFDLKIINYYVTDDKVTFEFKGKNNIIGTYYLSDEEDTNYSIGDIVRVSGKLSIPKNNTILNTFNYKKYLLSKNIYYVLKINNIEVINNNKNLIYSVKNMIINRVLENDINGYMYALILGNNKYIDEDVMNSYRVNSITHLFALSGMHVSLFASIISFFIKKLNEKKKLFIISIVLVFISFIASFTPSILRASLFYILLNFKKLYKINISNINLLVIIFCLFLIIRPYYIYNLSFIFSFAISFSFLFSSKYIKVKNKIISLLLSSVIGLLSSMPIIINNFYKINIIGFINNIFFIPYMSILYVFILLTLIFPFHITMILIDVMEYISIKNMSLLNITITFPKMNILEIIIYYFVLMLLLKDKSYKIILIYFIIIFLIYNKSIFDNNTYIYYIDVNQGDSTLIRTKNNKNILIDTGGLYNDDYFIKNYILFLNSLGIKNIDYLIISHGDYDHMGEAINLVENFKVEKVIFNCGEFNELEQDLIKVLDKRKIPYYSCIKELNIDNNKFHFLNNKDYGNENDNSSVIYTELDNHKFLFMGDAGVEVEEDLIEKYNLQDIDVLKVGHHGSRTSSGKNFIDEINPKYSIISVGKNNRYGHPNNEVLNNLKDSKIYITDIDGSIMFEIKNNKLRVETCTP